MRRGSRWTDADDDIMREWYEVLGPSSNELSKMLGGRSYTSLVTRAHKLGLHFTKYTKRDEELLTSGYHKLGYNWPGWQKVLSRPFSPTSIKRKAERMGLRGPHSRKRWTKRDEQIALRCVEVAAQQTGRDARSVAAHVCVMLDKKKEAGLHSRQDT